MTAPGATPAPAAPDGAEASETPDLGRMGFVEFIALIGVISSVVALSIDAMLPTLGDIAREFALPDPNDRQLVVTVFFAGFALSPIAFGLLSDAVGRRPALFLGFALFVLGALISFVSTSLDAMLAGRFLAGLGAAGPRILAVSIVRDRFEGAAMARVTSYTLSVFILTPALAPALGLGVATLGGWRSVFLMLMAVGLLAAIWAALRLPETLAPEHRRPVTWARVGEGLATALTNRQAMGWSLSAGFVFGALLTYIAQAQQLMAESYGLGGAFTAVFALFALGIGAGTIANARLVGRLGVRWLIRRAFLGLILVSALTLAVDLATAERLPFVLFLLWGLPASLCFGVLFGNLNALAMAPLGALAGLGSALVTSISTLVASSLALAAGSGFDGGPTSLLAAFSVFPCLALAVGVWADGAAPGRDRPSPRPAGGAAG